MEIISIINQKGGVGKTTTAQNLTAGLRLENKKVLLLDLDAQCNLTLLQQATKYKYNILNVLKNEVDINTAVEKDFIAGSKFLVGENTEIELNKLKNELQKLKTDYDYIIIDTPPALSNITINALTASTDIIITITADLLPIQGLIDLYKTVQSIQKTSNKNLNIKGILVTRFNKRTILGRTMLNSLIDIAEKLNTKVLNTKIRDSISIKESQAKMTDIFKYARYSTAGRDYRALVKEILEDK
ncbi:MAG: ParA family protein [Megamonas funiformis]|uniref:ParA family protein n=1 Tax=Megamonas funiformis TaxID=437897 RepID=UPI003990DDBA